MLEAADTVIPSTQDDAKDVDGDDAAEGGTKILSKKEKEKLKKEREKVGSTTVDTDAQ